MTRPTPIRLLASAARTATTATALIENPGARGIRLFLNVTAAPGVPGAGGLKVLVRARDPISGTKAEINAGGALITTAVFRMYEVYLNAGAAAGFIQEAVSRQLPAEFDVAVTHDDAQSYTYSLSAELLP